MDSSLRRNDEVPNYQGGRDLNRINLDSGLRWNDVASGYQVRESIYTETNNFDNFINGYGIRYIDIFDE